MLFSAKARRVMREQLDDDDKIDVKPFRQTPGWCGPATLKMVARYYGIEVTERVVAMMSDASRDSGTRAENLVAAAQELGFEAWVEDDSSIDRLRELVVNEETPVIVDWFSHDDGHYSVVVGIDDDEVKLQDPEIRRIRSIPIDEFERVWFDYDTNDGAPARDGFNVRRIIVIRPV